MAAGPSERFAVGLSALLLFAGCRDTANLAEPAAPAPVSAVGDPVAYARSRGADEVIEALAIRAGSVIADVGCGRGTFTTRLAQAAGPSGHVVAVDVDPSAVAAVAALPVEPADAPIEARRVDAKDPQLEGGRYDLIFLSDTDQYLRDRTAYLTVLGVALAPHGRLAVTNRMIYRDAVMHAASAAHFTVAKERPAPLGHFLVELVR